MKRIHIDEVRRKGRRVAVKQSVQRFDMIYRAAMGVDWDNAEGLLYIDSRCDSDLESLLGIIMESVKNEYYVTLFTDERTQFFSEDIS